MGLMRWHSALNSTERSTWSMLLLGPLDMGSTEVRPSCSVLGGLMRLADTLRSCATKATALRSVPLRRGRGPPQTEVS
jgi:hypothetical protein